jgi:hypothetical protein
MAENKAAAGKQEFFENDLASAAGAYYFIMRLFYPLSVFNVQKLHFNVSSNQPCI